MSRNRGSGRDRPSAAFRALKLHQVTEEDVLYLLIAVITSKLTRNGPAPITRATVPTSHKLSVLSQIDISTRHNGTRLLFFSPQGAYQARWGFQLVDVLERGQCPAMRNRWNRFTSIGRSFFPTSHGEVSASTFEPSSE